MTTPMVPLMMMAIGIDFDFDDDAVAMEMRSYRTGVLGRVYNIQILLVKCTHTHMFI
jgi:hypothetical protein